MQTDTLKRAIAALACVVLSFTALTACGSSNSSEPAPDTSSSPTDDTDSDDEQEPEPEPEPRTFSETFNSKQSIWFQGSPSKDDCPANVFVFEQGKVTTYTNLNSINDLGRCFTYGDFKGVSADGLLDKVKELSKAAFEREKSEGEIYQEPQPSDFTLGVATDASGNKVIREVLRFNHSDSYTGTSQTREVIVFDEDDDVLTQVVYDQKFTGWLTLNKWSRMSSANDPNPVMPTLDSLGTAGVKEEGLFDFARN